MKRGEIPKPGDVIALDDTITIIGPNGTPAILVGETGDIYNDGKLVETEKEQMEPDEEDLAQKNGL